MKKLKYIIMMAVLCLIGQNKVHAYNFFCTYDDTINKRTLYYNLETLSYQDGYGTHEFFYYNGEDTVPVGLSCSETTDWCLVSLEVMDRDGDLTCPSLYVSNIDGTYEMKYMGDGMPYTQVKVSNRYCDYPDDCNFYAQGSALENESKPNVNNKENKEEVYSKALRRCGLSDVPVALPIYVSNIINLIKIIVPILLVIMGMIDFTRAVIASDEKQMKEAQSRFIRRVIAGAIVFFVIAIVQFVFSSIKGDNFGSCVACFVSGNCDIQVKSEPACYQCNGRSNVYKWATNGDDDAACGSGYHILTNKTEEDCHS